MRLAERHREPDEAHFTEGELDLEAPEELAVGELDEDAILEEELDNEDVLEQDVDEDTLEVTLEDLVHGDDGGIDEVPVDLGTFLAPSGSGSETEEDAEEDVGGDDLEESLDLVLLERMALVDVDGAGDVDAEAGGVAAAGPGVLLQMRTDAVDLVDVAPCRSDEFVCRCCFLVRKRVQLVDTATLVCRDCST
jgi:hypothetical protein